MIEFWISTGLVPKLSNVEFSVASSAYKIKENLALLFITSLIKILKSRGPMTEHRYRFDFGNYFPILHKLFAIAQITFKYIFRYICLR